MRALSNLASTCWANAALQCLAHCPQLCRFFLTDKLHGRGMQLCNENTEAGAQGSSVALALALATFLRRYWRGEHLTRVANNDLREVVDLMSCPGEEGMPQDAHEAFTNAVHAVHLALREDFTNVPEAPSRARADVGAWQRHCEAPANGFSVLTEIFQTQVLQDVDGERSWDHPWQLALPPGAATAEALGAMLDATEAVDGKRVRRRITYLPLCVVLSGQDMRVDAAIDAGELGRFEAVAAAAIRGGHWVAVAKEDGRWWFCDDDRIQAVEHAHVQDLQGVQLSIYRRV